MYELASSNVRWQLESANSRSTLGRICKPVSSNLAAPAALCQNYNMKHLLLACLCPMTLTAQSMQQLTEQLGKTVLYGDVALSPDSTHVAWVQSTAASTSKQTYIRDTSGNAQAISVD